MKKIFKKIFPGLLIFVLFLLPIFALTADTVTGNVLPTSATSLKSLILMAIDLINSYIIPLLFAIAILAFVWGVVQFFFLNTADSKKRETGREFMMWSIIALAIMVSIWGLVAILTNTFNFSGTKPDIKTLYNF